MGKSMKVFRETTSTFAGMPSALLADMALPADVLRDRDVPESKASSACKVFASLWLTLSCLEDQPKMGATTDDSIASF
jgi:hypothetical protein